MTPEYSPKLYSHLDRADQNSVAAPVNPKATQWLQHH